MAEGAEPEPSRITWGRLWIGEVYFGYPENLLLKLSCRNLPFYFSSVSFLSMLEIFVCSLRMYSGFA